jgi:hypothetical protein
MQNLLDKRSREDTPATILRRQNESWRLRVRDGNVAMGSVAPVRAHTVFASIEYWGLNRVICPSSPVHILGIISLSQRYYGFGEHTGWYPL